MLVNLRLILRNSLLLLLLFIASCASYKKQIKEEINEVSQKDKIKHRFYLIGDAGNATENEIPIALKELQKQLLKENEKSTVLFLGDNIYPKGMPSKKNVARKKAEYRLNSQLNILNNFEGNSIFIPGNHDWYSQGLKGLKRQQEFIENRKNKKIILSPENGCPIEKVKISKNIVLINVDSQWYIENWDKHPNINKNCEIKTRHAFLDEFESLVKKAENKTVIVAMHHPLFTKGSHGGYSSWEQELYPMNNKIPLPGIGSFLNLIRYTSGASHADLQYPKYKELAEHLTMLSNYHSKLIFVGGHEHSLQYTQEEGVIQIVSGSGSKKSPVYAPKETKFAYAQYGFARLDVFKNGAVELAFYDAVEKKYIYHKEIFKAEGEKQKFVFEKSISDSIKASIYTQKETTKSKLHKLLLGKRYRKDFSTQINLKTVSLDTLFGGLKPVRRGGGHQSKSLRLETKNGKEYVMRALKKSALKYLQSVLFKTKVIGDDFNQTITEDVLVDGFTGSYPYAPFLVDDLSKAVGIYHSNPKLYYIPKQEVLGDFNSDFGDEIYMIEERVASGHGDLESFGFSNKIISTKDMLRNIKDNFKYEIDQKAYIRARLFDMLIGDWDRHEDQWRWAEFKEKEKVIYRPVPRDRDQAFSIMDDGFLVGLATLLEPSTRMIKSYSPSLKSVKWFNVEAFPLDKTLLKYHDFEQWETQANYITEHLTDELIDSVFEDIPKEFEADFSAKIKKNLKSRKQELTIYAKKYRSILTKFGLIMGTNEKDVFELKYLKNGDLNVKIYTNKKEKLVTNHVFKAKETKEVWIYGLDKKDVFQLRGKNPKIRIKIVGGHGKDVYDFESNRKVNAYDYIDEEFKTLNKARVGLSNRYDLNVYNPKKFKNNLFMVLPLVGSNPDDGWKVSLDAIYTKYSFVRNPFSSKHRFKATFYGETKGFDFHYKSTMTTLISNWNLSLESNLTSGNYSVNFFGYGESLNPEEDLGENYNRVKLKTFNIKPSMQWRGTLGSVFEMGVGYESNQVKRTDNRFVDQYFSTNDKIFKDHSLFGAWMSYHYENYQNKSYPTKGMAVDLEMNYKQNVSLRNSFVSIKPSLSFSHELFNYKPLVLATKLGGNMVFGQGYSFYQSANIGGDQGLRGYRNQRFSGEKAFYQSTDLRMKLSKIKTGFIPIDYGVFAGFDYGRIWYKEKSENWHSDYGFGLWLGAMDKFNANISGFKGSDDWRIVFGLGFEF